MTDLILTGLCGSLRAASTNRLLMHEARRLFAPSSFHDGDLRLPLYDGDVETAGIPPQVQTLADQIAQADAVIVVTPEYNKGIPGVLKNALDWVSRVDGNPWLNKPVAIMSAAAGRAGGERSQQMLRWCLNPFRPRVLPGPEVMIAQSAKAFDAQERLSDDVSVRMLTTLMQDLRAEAEWLRTR